MQEEIVAQGFELMLYGMGTVVLFLALLVVATTAMSRAVGRWFSEPSPTPPAVTGGAVSATASADPDAEVVAVISAALQQHRRKYSQRSK